MKESWSPTHSLLVIIGLLLILFGLTGCAHRQPVSDPYKLPEKSALTLTALPTVMIRPGFVRLRATLTEGADVARLDCAAVQWSYGDGEASLRQVLTNCEGIQRSWTTFHRYHSYGEFKPAFYLRSQVDGSILLWAEANVVVQPMELE